jgi:hypothetical protein
MEKFKVRLSYQDMVLEVEGAREDIPVITQTLGERFKNLVGSTLNTFSPSEQITKDADATVISNAPKELKEAKSGRKPGRKKGTRIVEKDGKKVVVDASEAASILTQSDAPKSLKAIKLKPSAKATEEKIDNVEKSEKKGKVGRPAKPKSEAVQTPENPKEAQTVQIKSKPIKEVKEEVKSEPILISTPIAKEPSVINWEKHDRNKYGFPESSWEKSDMMLWMLFVAPNYSSFENFSLRQIVDTVNANYKPTRRLRDETAFRELSSYKRGKNVFVKEGPIGRFSLTPAGMDYVKNMITEKMAEASEAEVW